MRQRRMRRRMAVVGVLVLLLAAVAVGGLLSGGGGTTAAGTAFETEELAPALAAKLAANASFVPQGTLTRQEGDRGADDEFVKHAAPGDSVPSAAIQQALADWKKVKGRATGGKSDWSPLGPSHAQGLDNQYRDRSVYNAGTPDFSGRIAHVAIDPNCSENGPVHALDRERERRCLAHEQRARRVAEVAVRLERLRAQQHGVDRARPERQAGPDALRRHRRAQRLRLGLRGGRRDLQVHERRQHLGRPPRQTPGPLWHRDIAVSRVQQQGRRLDRGQARRFEHHFRGLRPRRPRRLERLLRRRGRADPGRAALRPLPVDERWRVLGSRASGRTRPLHRVDARRGLAQHHAVLAARRAPRDGRSGRPEHRLRGVLRPRHLAVEVERRPGLVRADHGAGHAGAADRRRRHRAARVRRRASTERRDADVRRRRRRRAS